MTRSELTMAEVKAPVYGAASTKIQLRFVPAKNKEPLPGDTVAVAAQPLRAGYNSLVPDLGLQRHLAHPPFNNKKAAQTKKPMPLRWFWLSRLLGKPQVLITAEPDCTQAPPKA